MACQIFASEDSHFLKEWTIKRYFLAKANIQHAAALAQHVLFMLYFTNQKENPWAFQLFS